MLAELRTGKSDGASVPGSPGLNYVETTADAFRANLANPMTVKRCRSW